MREEPRERETLATVGASVPRPAAWVALGVGLALLAHPPAGLWPLAFGMLAPLVLALEGRGPAAAWGLGWAYSAAMGLGICHWLVHALVVEYGMASVAAWALLGGVVALYALVPAAACAAYALLRPRVPPAWAPLVFAAAFVASEWLRSGPLGLPWVLAAHTLARVPLLLQTAELGGAWAVGLPPVAFGAGLGLAWARRSVRPVLAPLLLVAAALVWGGLRLRDAAEGGPRVRVAVVQAAVPQRERFQPGSAWRNTERHASLSREALGRDPADLVVWSETAVDDDLDAEPGLRADLSALVDALGVPLLTGAPRSPGGRRMNAVVLFAPGRGLVETYAKQRLVPFSEYDPPWGGPLARLVAPLTEGEGYAAGREATVFRAGPVPLATPVCFEITYPDLVRGFERAGAAVLVNLSNDAWFGRTAYGEIHFRHALLRAVEFHTWVVRGANTGISAVVDPRGRVVRELGLFEEGTLRAEIGAGRRVTLYERAGDGPVLALLAALGCAALLASRGQGGIAARRTRRRREPT